MEPSKFERVLRRWGRVFGEAPPQEWDVPTSEGLGALSQRMLVHAEVGKGRQEKTERKRREEKTVHYIGKNGMRIGVDHEASQRHKCFGTETRSASQGKWEPDEIAVCVDRLCLLMHRGQPDQAVIVRIEYCTEGLQKEDKLPRVREILQKPEMKIWTYRAHLDFARQWLNGAYSTQVLKLLTCQKQKKG